MTSNRLDTRLARAILKTMEVHLPQTQEAQLNELAARTGHGTDELIDELFQEAVARLLAHDEWFKQQVQVGVSSSHAKKQRSDASRYAAATRPARSLGAICLLRRTRRCRTRRAVLERG